MGLNPAQTLYLDQVQRELAEVGHGGKAEVIERAARHLGVSTGTVQRWLKEHLQHDSGRKRRVDAGQRAVSDAELRLISAALYGTIRQNGKRIMTFDTAVEMLRVNGQISTDLSAARLATILAERGLHPGQLKRPEPAIEQRSLHPNHVWQVDASVCVAYYLSNATGLQVMDEKKFYKNKPGHVTRIQSERLVRYAKADHYTHEVLTRYYLGSESAAHLTDFLIWCFSQKDGHIVHGVPFILQMDMGSANTSKTTLNFLERMKVRVIVHERHNSRANGSVEKAHDIIETHFESALRFSNVADLDDLNAKALTWSNWFGATRKHSRYHDTRHNLWMTITPEQLRIAPPEDVMRELVTTHPVQRRVSNNLTITFAMRGHGSSEYDLRYVPGVMAGAKVDVVLSPYRMPAIDVAYADAETGEVAWMTVEPIALAADGRREDAPVIGEDLRAAPRGLLERNRDQVLKVAYGADTPEEAATAHEKGALVFGGAVDPFKPAADAELPAYLPRRGTELATTARQVEVPRLNTVEACKRLKAALGDAYDPPRVYAWIEQRFGAEGVPEDHIDAIARQMQPQTAPAPLQGGLRAVGGDQ